MNRRRFVATVATGASGVAAGCIGGLLDDLTTYEATPATVSDAALEETGYESQGTEEMVETREFAGEEVEVTNYTSEYRRTIELPGVQDVDAGVFATIATPQVSVAGEDFNPVADWDRRRIVDEVQGQYEQLEVGQSIGTRSVNGLGETIEVETFEGEAAIEPAGTIDVLLDVASPDHGDDHLVLVGIYPADVPDEDERIDTLVDGLEHED